MYKLIGTLVLAASLTACQGGKINFSKFSGKSNPINTSFFSDQSVGMSVSVALAKDKQLWKDSHINVLYHNKALLLVGQTNSTANKLKSERIASNVEGIDKIYNQIEVIEPTSYTQRATDTWLTTQIKAKYFANKNVGFNDVKVLTENGKVFLMGTLTKQEQKTAVDIASEVDGVKEVLKVFEDKQSDNA